MKSDIWVLFRKYVKKIQVSLKSDKNEKCLYTNIYVHLQYLAEFFSEGEMFQTKVLKN